jgi:hypothetical protein
LDSPAVQNASGEALTAVINGIATVLLQYCEDTLNINDNGMTR